MTGCSWTPSPKNCASTILTVYQPWGLLQSPGRLPDFFRLLPKTTVSSVKSAYKRIGSMTHIRVLRLFAAVGTLALTVFASASAVASTSAPDIPTSVGLPAGKVLVIGDIARTQVLDVAALRKLPSKTVTVTFMSGSGVEHHVYVGPRLVDVLTQAAPRFDPSIKNDKLRHYISVSATDGYRALVAYGEIDPSFENKDVLLATSEDGHPLDADGPRLVVPGDISGGRYVSNVNRVFLQKSPL